MNSDVSVTEGAGKNVATYSISEDAVTKEVQRIVLNDSGGVEIVPATAAKQDTMIGHLDGVEGLLTTIDSDTSAIKTASEAIQAAVEGTLDVTVVSALPAGNNNIGDVDIASSVLPSGASTSAKQDTIIGHLDGVEGLLSTIDGHIDGIEGSVDGIEALIGTTNSTLSTIDGRVDGIEGLLTTIDASLNDIESSLEETLDIFRSLDLDESEEEVKASAGRVHGWYFFNAATSIRYLKFYNATAASVTVGTTTPVLTIPLPAQSSGGVGANVLGAKGIGFSTAISAAVTTGLADNDTGAPGTNEVVVNIFYK